jgi:hypothetical protein
MSGSVRCESMTDELLLLTSPPNTLWVIIEREGQPMSLFSDSRGGRQGG